MNHNTGYWEDGSAGTYGSVLAVLSLWLADVLSQTRHKHADGSHAAPVLGTGQWDLRVGVVSDRVEKQPRRGGHQGEQVTKSGTGSLSPTLPLVSEHALQERWKLTPTVEVTVGAWPESGGVRRDSPSQHWSL